MKNERLIKALILKYKSEKEQGRMTLELLTEHVVGIGDHSANDIMKDAEIALERLVDAEDKLEMLNKLFPNVEV